MGGLAGAVAGLQKIADNIGALPYGTFAGTLSEMIARGEIVEPHRGDVFRTPDGKVVYLYISDANNLTKDNDKRNKVHIFMCSTLSRMRNLGLDETRYIATTEVTNAGMFRLENGKMVKLSVCEHCYKSVRSSKYGSATNFKYADFSKDRFITPKVGFRKGRLDPRITRF